MNAFLFFPQPGKERSTAYFLRIISNSVIALQVALKQPDYNLDDTNFLQSDCIKLKNFTPDSQPVWTKRKSGLGLFSSKEKKTKPKRKQTNKKKQTKENKIYLLVCEVLRDHVSGAPGSICMTGVCEGRLWAALDRPVTASMAGNGNSPQGPSTTADRAARSAATQVRYV